MNLKHETWISNLIVWPSIQAILQSAVFDAHLMVVQGQLQSQSGIINVIA